MWLKLILPVVIYLLLLKPNIGIDISSIQKILLCEHVTTLEVKQKGYSLLYRLRGSGAASCMANKMVFCKAWKQDMYCRVMDHRMVVTDAKGGISSL